MENKDELEEMMDSLQNDKRFGSMIIGIVLTSARFWFILSGFFVLQNIILKLISTH